MVLQRDVVLSFLLRVRSAHLANVLLILTSVLQIILLVTGNENVHVPRERDAHVSDDGEAIERRIAFLERTQVYDDLQTSLVTARS